MALEEAAHHAQVLHVQLVRVEQDQPQRPLSLEEPFDVSQGANGEGSLGAHPVFAQAGQEGHQGSQPISRSDQDAEVRDHVPMVAPCGGGDQGRHSGLCP